MATDTSSSNVRSWRPWHALLAALVALSVATLAVTSAAEGRPAQNADDVLPPPSLEPLDPVVEDVVVPNVFVPAGDALEPVGDNAPRLFGDPFMQEEPFHWYDFANDTLIETAGTLVPGLNDSSSLYDLQVFWFESGGTGNSQRQRTGIAEVPQLLDLTGNGLFDISVEVRDVETRPVLRIMRLPGAPTEVLGVVSVRLAPEGWSSPERLSLHARSFYSSSDVPSGEVRGFPALTRVTMTGPDDESDDLAVEVETTEPGHRLGVVMTDGDFAETPPTMTMDLSPVPDHISVVATDVMSGFDSGTVSVAASGPNGARVTYRTSDAAGTVLGHLVANGVTETAEIDFTRDRFSAMDATLSASTPVDQLSLAAADSFSLGSGDIPKQVGVGVEDMGVGSAMLHLTRNRFTSELQSPTGAVGFIFGDEEMFDRSGQMSALVEGIPDDLTLDLSDIVGSTVELDLDGQPVDRLDLRVGDQEIPLDPDVDAVFLKERNSLFGLVARVPNPRSVEITTTDGLDASIRGHGDRPFVMGTTQTQFPSSGCSDPADCPFAIAMLSSTPDDIQVHLDHNRDTLDTTFDYSASSSVDELHVSIDPNHHRVFSPLRCGDGECFAARVEQLPTDVAATFGDESFAWSTSEGVPRFDVELTLPPDDAGKEREVTANGFDVPADVSMAFGDDATGSGEPSTTIRPLRVLASEPTTLHLLSTIGTAMTSIENLRVRSFGIDGSFTDCGLDATQVCGHLWIDTLPVGGNTLADADELEGTLQHRSDSTELDFTFGEAFRAASRKAVFSNFPDHPSSPLELTASGEIDCTPGTILDGLQVASGLTFDARELVC